MTKCKCAGCGVTLTENQQEFKLAVRIVHWASRKKIEDRCEKCFMAVIETINAHKNCIDPQACCMTIYDMKKKYS